MDEQLRQLLNDLSKSLHAALSDSPEIERKLDRIRQEGYAIYLLLDADRRGEKRIRLEESAPSAPRSERPPIFRINGQDLSFLRSIGIDPTRQLKRRGASQTRSEEPK